jgi:hypothetical protein
VFVALGIVPILLAPLSLYLMGVREFSLRVQIYSGIITFAVWVAIFWILWRGTRGVRLALCLALLAVVAWGFTRSRQATVRVSSTAFARFESQGIYQWFSLSGVPLTYFEDGKSVGEVRFAYGPETHPLGIFPGPDSQTLICVYGTDLTMGVFAVELNKRSEHAVAPPPEMFRSGIVKSTNFGLRRCAKSEVDQLRHFIDSVSDAALREMTYPGFLLGLHPDRNSLLKEIERGSGMYHRDPSDVNDIPEVYPGISPCD